MSSLTRQLLLLVAPLATLAALPAYGGQRPVRVVTVNASADRTAWLERFELSREGPEETKTIVKTFKLTAGGSVDIFNLSGDLIVTGVEGDQIQVAATKRVRGENAKARIEDIGVSFNESPGRLEVRSALGGARNEHAEVDFEIEVPFNTVVVARTIAGDIQVSHVHGDVQMESTSGTVEALDTPRLIRMKTMSGDVKVTDGAATDALSASTVSGDIEVHHLKARSIEAVSVSGDLTLIDAVCDRAQLRTVNGDVQFAGPMAKGGRYELNSHSGDIRVQPMGGGFELSARTFSGELVSELPLTMAPEPGGGGDIPGLPKNRDIRGTFGDGSAMLVVRTFSGDLMLGPPEDPAHKDKPVHKKP